MPYHNGKRVSNEEWRRLRGDKPLSWQEASGYGNAEEALAEPEATEKPKVRKRRGTKKADAEAAVAAITGLDINLGDEEEQE